jgi:hypothetical protein
MNTPRTPRGALQLSRRNPTVCWTPTRGSRSGADERYLSNIRQRTEATFQLRERQAEGVSPSLHSYHEPRRHCESLDEEIDRVQRVRALLTGPTAPLKRGLAPKRRKVSAVELRKDAADERDAADRRLEDHKRSCAVCQEAIRLFQISHKKS